MAPAVCPSPPTAGHPPAAVALIDDRIGGIPITVLNCDCSHDDAAFLWASRPESPARRVRAPCTVRERIWPPDYSRKPPHAGPKWNRRSGWLVSRRQRHHLGVAAGGGEWR